MTQMVQVIVDGKGLSGLDLKVMAKITALLIKYRIFFDYLFLLVLELIMIFSQTDPGVPIVYAGFGSLMFTTCISFLFYLIHR